MIDIILEYFELDRGNLGVHSLHSGVGLIKRSETKKEEKIPTF